MFWKEQVSISKQMYENSREVIYIMRFFGLFPITVHRNESKLFLKWSPLYAFYSIVVGIFVIFSDYYNILYDVFVSKDTIKAVSITDLIVYTGGISTYVIVLFSGIFIISTRFTQFFEYIKCLNKIDNLIHTTYTKLDKYLSIAIVIILILLETLCTKLEIYLIYRKYGDEIGLIGILKNYLAFDLSILITLIINYSNRHLACSIKKRLRVLNTILERECIEINGRRRVSAIHDLNTIITARGSQQHQNASSEIIEMAPFFGENTATIIRTKKIYLQLIDTANFVTQLISVNLLMETVSVFFQLVESLYLFIVPLTRNRMHWIEMTPKALMFCINITRVLLITEPWYSCTVEVEITKRLVCSLLSMNTSRRYRKEVDAFAVILGLRELKFSVYGMFTVHRLLFTSLIGSITTLLVILLQYKEDV